jgi:hypothetical protein
LGTGIIRIGWNLLVFRSIKFAALALVGAVLTVVPPFHVARAQPAEVLTRPFEAMAGTWTGTGSVTLGSGDKERIRCRVTYVVSNAAKRVEQELRCASDSYKFELNSDINYANGHVTGRWSERTQRTSGTISGRARAGSIEALAETSGFAAFFTMTTRGDQQTVQIESKSSEVTEVNITLRRTGK